MKDTVIGCIIAELPKEAELARAHRDLAQLSARPIRAARDRRFLVTDAGWDYETGKAVA